MPGPAPKPNAVRRNSRVGPLKLPAEGRKGKTPEWPLIADVAMTAKRDIQQGIVLKLEIEVDEETDPRKRGSLKKKLAEAQQNVTIYDRQLEAQRDLEVQIWRDVWATPQAVAWERNGWIRDVAQYVRHKVLGELGSLDDAKEARAWSDRLGLNPKAMRALLWEVVEDETSQQRESKTDARKRIKAV